MTSEEWRLHDCIKRAEEAIAKAWSWDYKDWYMCYAATLYRDDDPTFIARPLIYDRMTDAEKAKFERLENASNIKAVCELCLAVYKRELPKMRAELKKLTINPDKQDV